MLAASGSLLSSDKAAPQLIGEVVIAAAAARSGTLGRRPLHSTMLALMSDIQVMLQLCNAETPSDYSTLTAGLRLTGHWRQRIVIQGLLVISNDVSSRSIQLAWGIPPEL